MTDASHVSSRIFFFVSGVIEDWLGKGDWKDFSEKASGDEAFWADAFDSWTCCSAHAPCRAEHYPSTTHTTLPTPNPR